MTSERTLHTALLTAVTEARPALSAGPLIAAVSGGKDSSALALGLASLHNRGLLADRSVILAHVDHGLHERRREAAAFVRDLAERLGLDHAERCVAPSPNAGEDELRRLRFEALQGLVAERDAAALLTAHHADDDVETLLLRVARGTGARGLAGIPRRRELPGGRPILRPLLDLPRRLLDEVVASAGLTPVDDPSNKDRRRARNALRLDGMHEFRGRHGEGFEPRLLTLARAARRRAEQQFRAARAWLAQNRQPRGPRSVMLTALPSQIPSEALRIAHLELCGADPTPRWASRTRRLSRSGAICSGGGPLQAERCRQGLLLRSGQPQTTADPVCLPTDGRWQEFGQDGWQLRAHDGPAIPSPGTLGVSVAADRLAVPLTARAALPGDRIELPSGPRSIRSLMQRAAVPSLERPLWPVLVDAHDRIVWLPGIAQSGEMAPTASLRLEARRVGGGIPQGSSPY